MKHPNVVFVFADQMRGQATGYAGDPNAITPNLDKLAAESIVFTNAVAGCPVCSPYRASLVTGQYPHTHGIFLNDLHLQHKAVSIADAFDSAGYNTGWIGKWHIDGHGRTRFTPPERRQGFKFWRAVECCHDYNHSVYYADTDRKLYWNGYDAIAQAQEAKRYIENYQDSKPFALFVSWGPPHDPYDEAPEQFKKLFSPEKLVLRKNVQADFEEKARQWLAGYYSHISALDYALGIILETIRKVKLEDETILIFTSDHGDMLGSQGEFAKQRPWDESILVPFLLRYPGLFGKKRKIFSTPFNVPHIMPTLLSLCGIKIPETVEGKDFTKALCGIEKPPEKEAILSCYCPFGQWTRKQGGREYRGLRTERYTYVRDLKGPWLFYDNEKDPYQLNNLCNNPDYEKIQSELEVLLREKLQETKDEFRPGEYYIEKWGYSVDENLTVPYWMID
ncbi:MAG: sulfatase [Candidatus Omnitrophica bacterium]|nr:sulfatase [Candidatus Omnitrophota bacterium]MCM8828261.1 sulfatase [Candidatus Omnitrophota bacterium]